MLTEDWVWGIAFAEIISRSEEEAVTAAVVDINAILCYHLIQNNSTSSIQKNSTSNLTNQVK